MKNWLLSFALVMLSSFTFGQQPGDYVVEPGDPGVLNVAVTRYLDSVTYVLKRGEYYFLTEKISTEFPLHIKAEEGDGARPIIQCLPDAEGANFASVSPSAEIHFSKTFTSPDMMHWEIIVKNIFRVDVDRHKIQNGWLLY